MSAAQHNTVTIEQGDLVYDSGLTIGQVKRMTASEGDFDAIIGVLSEIIIEWPFEGSPSQIDSWDNLKLTDFQVIAEAVTGSLGKELA